MSLRYEKKTIETMIRMYCRAKHGTRMNDLCDECERLRQYAYERLDKCPFGEKKGPCSKCPVHCYQSRMRQLAREVMKYAGPRMIWKHPVLAARHLVSGFNKFKRS